MTEGMKDRFTMNMDYEDVNINAIGLSGEDCIHCGSCTRRCPFGIDASENMRKAERIFGC